MPIYEYLCKKCGEFEVTQRITDKPLSKCPTCKSKVTKQISSTSFQLKGSGWYITDYGRSGSQGKSGAGETKSEKSDKAEKSESSSEKSSSSTTSESSKSSTKSTKASAAAAA